MIIPVLDSYPESVLRSHIKADYFEYPVNRSEYAQLAIPEVKACGMDINVTFSEDPAWVLSIAREFLTSQPVLHNMIHSLLHARIAYREPGRFWIGARSDKIVAVVFQSPLTFAADLTPMGPNVAAATVDAIADAGLALPGVSGEAATAASFAGQWTE